MVSVRHCQTGNLRRIINHDGKRGGKIDEYYICSAIESSIERIPPYSLSSNPLTLSTVEKDEEDRPKGGFCSV